MIEIVTGDLLNSKEKYIAHQCNCISTGAAGIAQAIFEKYPYSDVYSSREEVDTPGTIKIMGNGKDERHVINMFSQYYPGGMRYPDSTQDGVLMRQKFFHQALKRIAKLDLLESIAFPWRIGCGIAGGDWEWYLGTLTNFAKYVNEAQNANVFIYQREGDE